MVKMAFGILLCFCLISLGACNRATEDIVRIESGLLSGSHTFTTFHANRRGGTASVSGPSIPENLNTFLAR